MPRRLSIWVVIGTRPEAIKMCPVVKQLRQQENVDVTLCFTGQHPDMVLPILTLFDEKADVTLSVMSAGQTLPQLSAKLLLQLEDAFSDKSIDAVLVHGDTTSSSMASLAAYYRRIPVAHVEAGLRTTSLYSPWPEEGNRRMNAVFSRWHFAPTKQAAQALASEGVSSTSILITGNTVIDALYYMVDTLKKSPTKAVAALEAFIKPDTPLVLITGHRRENHGSGLEGLCQAIKTLALRYPDHTFVYPVHPNPNVQKSVNNALAGIQNIALIPPQPYDAFVVLMQRSVLILTDSGGIQEEAPALGVPVLVCRESTERPEAIQSGWAQLVGTDPQTIIRCAEPVLRGEREKPMSGSPYGDGKSAERIVTTLLQDLISQVDTL